MYVGCMGLGKGLFVGCMGRVCGLYGAWLHVVWGVERVSMCRVGQNRICIHTTYDRTSGDFTVKNTVYSPFIYTFHIYRYVVLDNPMYVG